MHREVSHQDKHLNFGLTSMRIEVQKCLNLQSSDEIEIHMIERVEADIKREEHLAEYLAKYSVGVRRTRTFHRHSEIEIVLVETGRLGNLIGGELVWMYPGMMAAFWGAVPHTPVGVVPGTIFNWITIPFSWFMDWQLPQAFNEAILAAKTLREPDDRDAASDRELFSRWHRDLREDSAESRKIVLLECEARLRRLARRAMTAPCEAGRLADAAHGSAGSVERMTRFVASHYAEALRTADVAAHVGLHPNYAGSLFRKVAGVSLLDYIKEYRIYHAQRLLATTDQKIITIANDAGFGSASRFYCAFKKACGKTPRAYRRGTSSLLRPGALRGGAETERFLTPPTEAPKRAG